MHVNFVLDASGLEALCTAAGLGEASVLIEKLEPSGRVAARTTLRPAGAFYPASMIKLPIAMVLATLCNSGARAWSDRFVVARANLTTNDAPSPFVAGYRATLEELTHAMLAASDNVATNVLVDVIGRERLTQACRELGLRETTVARKLSGSLPLIDDPAATGRNVHPAEECAALLRLLARDRGTTWSVVVRALEAQIWNDKLSRGLSPGDSFAHKTGDTDEVSHDGGILTLPDGTRFIIIVYTALPSDATTDARFAAFMRALRPHLAKNTR